MGQATLREARRQIRRAVGPAALDTIRDQEQMIRDIGNAVHHQRVALEALQLRVEAQQDLHAVNLTLATVVLRRNLLGRLRWIVTGR